MLALPRLRHAVSCDVDLRHSLPDSPRQPRLVSIRAPRSSRHGDHSMEKAELSSSISLSEEPKRNARGRNVPLTRPPSLVISHPPTIVLSPPTSPCHRRNSFASFLSSDYPSEPASSVYDDYTTTSESSDSAFSTSFDEVPVDSNRGSSYAGVVRTFKDIIFEEKNVPRSTFSENTFNSILMSRVSGRLFQFIS